MRIAYVSTGMDGNILQWNAELYQDSSSLQFQLGLLAIERLNPRDREQILDIGCGNGLLTIELAKRIPSGRVTGVEVSSEMITKAADNISRHGVSNVRFLNMNALDISFESEFDAVFSNSAIHWIHDQETIYGLIFKSLAGSGRIMIQKIGRAHV
jgi:trans-aconitate 2-methyltransferase